MCISFTNEGKTQVGWVATVRQKSQRSVNANNTLPKGSPYHVSYLNEMTMKSPCLEAFEK
jgi:hypothetical protein